MMLEVGFVGQGFVDFSLFFALHTSHFTLREITIYRKDVIQMEDFFNNLNWVMLLKAFAVGGAICIVGQILIDKTKLTPARILVIFVTTGAVLRRIRSISIFN